MTNHIEEMMKTAGVEARCQTEDGTGCKYCLKGYSCKLHRNRADCFYMLDGWDFNYYPDFTAEKQLEIIKLIAKDMIHIQPYPCENKDWWLNSCSAEGVHTDFTQALAQLTTELMNAGELDKSKVKEILE